MKINSPSDEFKRVIKEESEQLINYVNNLDIDSLNIFLDNLTKLKGKLIVIGIGKSGLVGRKIAATLSSTGTSSFFIHPSEAFHGDLGMIESKDNVLVLSNSGESKEVVELIPYIKNKCSKIFSITKNPESTIAIKADFHLKVKVSKESCPLNLAPMSSTTLLMAVGDAIASTLMIKKKITKIDFSKNHPGGSLGKILNSSVKDFCKPWLMKNRVTTLDLISFMVENKSTAVVVKFNNIFKLITDGDIRRGISKYKSIPEFNSIGSENPFCILSNQSIINAKKEMQKNKISSLVVIENNEPIGTLVIEDIML